MNDKRKTNLGDKKGLITTICLIMYLLSYFIGYKGFFEIVGNCEGISGAVIMLASQSVTFYLAWKIQIIIHEIGHAVVGKLTGYKLISLHIGKFSIVSNSGKYNFKKYSISGKAGRCFMRLPEASKYKFSHTLYYIGGSFFNLIFSILFLYLYFLKPEFLYVSFQFVALFTMGMIQVLINGIPMYLSGQANDGMELYTLINNKEAQRAFTAQLIINGLSTKETKLHDIPGDLFNLPEDMDLSNPHICTLGVLRFSYLCEMRQYEEAMRLGRFLVCNAACISKEQRNSLLCGLMSYEMTSLCRKEEVDKFYTAEFQKCAIESPVPVYKLLLYAYELLINRNIEQAEKHFEEYEKRIKKNNYDAGFDEFISEVKAKEIELQQQDNSKAVV